jgi:hypothetical protein
MMAHAAFHEAGHAAVAWVLGCRVLWMELKDRGATLGQTAVYGPAQEMTQDDEDEVKRAVVHLRLPPGHLRDALEIDLLHTLAGRIATGLAEGSKAVPPLELPQRTPERQEAIDESKARVARGEEGHGDEERVDLVTRWLTGSDDEQEAFKGWLELRAENLLVLHWDRVDRLARALHEKGRLEGEEIEELLGGGA